MVTLLSIYDNKEERDFDISCLFQDWVVVLSHADHHRFV